MDKLGEGGGGGGGGVNGGFGDLQQLLLGQHFWFWPQNYKQLRYWDIFNHFKIGGFLISEENVNKKKRRQFLCHFAHIHNNWSSRATRFLLQT